MDLTGGGFLAQVTATVEDGHAMAESLMADTCRVDRVIGETVDADGALVPVYLNPPPYEGKCKVQTYEPHEQTPEVGGGTRVVQRYSLHLPVDAGPVEVGDLATITTPGKPERVFRVAGTHGKTWQTAQRLLVDEQTGGGGQ